MICLCDCSDSAVPAAGSSTTSCSDVSVQDEAAEDVDDCDVYVEVHADSDDEL